MNKIKSFEYLDTSDRILKLKEVVSYINDMLFYLKDDGFNIVILPNRAVYNTRPPFLLDPPFGSQDPL